MIMCTPHHINPDTVIVLMLIWYRMKCKDILGESPSEIFITKRHSHFVNRSSSYDLHLVSYLLRKAISFPSAIVNC